MIEHGLLPLCFCLYHILKRCSLFKYNLSPSSFSLYIDKAFSSVFLLHFFKNKPFHRKKIIEVIILYPCNKL